MDEDLRMLPFYTSENLQQSLVNSYAFCFGSAPPQSCLIYPNKKKEEKFVYVHGRYCMSLHHENWSLEPLVFGFPTLNRTHSILYALPRSLSVFPCCICISYHDLYWETYFLHGAVSVPPLNTTLSDALTNLWVPRNKYQSCKSSLMTMYREQINIQIN